MNHSRRNTAPLTALKIFCLALPALLMARPSPAATEAGFTSLFDGKSLAGWKMSGEGVYLVKSGVLICPEGTHGNFYTEKEFSDFVLRLDYKLQAGGNNGVGIDRKSVV